MFGKAKLRGQIVMLEEYKLVLEERVGKLQRELNNAKVVSATYAQANGSLIAEVTDLRNKVAMLEDRLKHSIPQDPKTGRMLKKGQWNGHEPAL